MGKYLVLQLLWSPSENKYIHPGEIVELDDDIALLLLKKDAVAPAVQPSIQPAQVSRKRLEKYEVKHGTDN